MYQPKFKVGDQVEDYSGDQGIVDLVDVRQYGEPDYYVRFQLSASTWCQEGELDFAQEEQDGVSA